MKRSLLPLTLTLLGLLTSCKDNAEAQAKQAAEELAALKKRMTVVAQAAADRHLIASPACMRVQGEGTLYSAADANLLPELRMLRFLEDERVAVRQIVERRSNAPQTRFFITDAYRDNYDERDRKYCFGRWAIADITPVPEGKGERRANVMMYPFDVTLVLTQIPSQTWLESQLVRENLTDGLSSITEPLKIRAVLPTRVEQLPPPDSAKRLDR